MCVHFDLSFFTSLIYKWEMIGKPKYILFIYKKKKYFVIVIKNAHINLYRDFLCSIAVQKIIKRAYLEDSKLLCAYEKGRKAI